MRMEWSLAFFSGFPKSIYLQRPFFLADEKSSLRGSSSSTRHIKRNDILGGTKNNLVRKQNMDSNMLHPSSHVHVKHQGVGLQTRERRALCPFLLALSVPLASIQRRLSLVLFPISISLRIGLTRIISRLAFRIAFILVASLLLLAATLVAR